MKSLVGARDFERVLKSPSKARSPHFAVHHLAASPVPWRAKLSTGEAASSTLPVDESFPTAVWLGLVVPKRHARRSVTRTLVKRQMREAMRRHAVSVAGLWVVRLRSPLDRQRFPSAASTALAAFVRAELDQLLAAAVKRLNAVALASAVAAPASASAPATAPVRPT